MEKNIKQMAEEYARTYLFSPQGAKGPDEHYIDGANAVLEEVMKVMEVSQVRSYHEVYDDLVELVKAIKGE